MFHLISFFSFFRFFVLLLLMNKMLRKKFADMRAWSRFPHVNFEFFLCWWWFHWHTQKFLFFVFLFVFKVFKSHDKSILEISRDRTLDVKF